MNKTHRQFDLYEAITDILAVFISSEIGSQVEFNNEAIAQYIDSFNCIAHFWDAKTKEDVYKQFTDDILNGYPVWRMVKIPEWTEKMIEKSFSIECFESREAYKKKYRCLTCKYYKEIETQLGILKKCMHERCGVNTHSCGHTPGILINLRRICKLYDRKT